MIVCNSTPLIALARCGQFELLGQVYGALLVPQEVWDEVVVQGAGRPGADETRDAEWIEVVSVSDATAVEDLRSSHPPLGAGEAAAIVLARERVADLLLADDPCARSVALGLGLSIGGTLSTVLEAKAAGISPTARELLDELRDSGFHIGGALYRAVLDASGE